MPFKDPAKRREITRRHYCAHRESYYARNRRKRRRMQALIGLIKSGMGCYYCQNSDSRMLEFHHLNPSEKSGNVSNLVRGWTWRRVFMEIAKCRVVCRNCHARLEFETRKRAQRRVHVARP